MFVCGSDWGVVINHQISSVSATTKFIFTHPLKQRAFRLIWLTTFRRQIAMTFCYSGIPLEDTANT